MLETLEPDYPLHKMLSVEKCREYLPTRDISNDDIEKIRYYIYSLAKEIINKNIKIYEEHNRKTVRGEQGKQ